MAWIVEDSEATVGARWWIADGPRLIGFVFEEEHARLIAAAPEMEEVLEEVEWIRGFGTGDWRFCPLCKSWEHKGHLPDCKIANAITKARGES